MPRGESHWSERHTYGQKRKPKSYTCFKTMTQRTLCELFQSLLLPCTTRSWHAGRLQFLSLWAVPPQACSSNGVSFPTVIIPSEIGEGLADTWRLFKDIVRASWIRGDAQPPWERNTQGRSKKLLEIRSLNVRWAFCWCLQHVSFILLQTESPL